MQKKTNNKLPIILSVFSTVVLLVVSLLWFNTSIAAKVSETNKEYLVENTQALSAVFRTKLDDQIIMLESQVRYFENIDLNDYSEMKKTIMSTKGIGAFNTIGVANAKGITLDYNGKTSGDATQFSVFNDAMQGRNAVSDTFVADSTGENVIIVALPIKQNGVTAGVIYGTFGREMLSMLMNIAASSSTGSHLLLDSSGNILAASEGFDRSYPGATNVFSDLSIKKTARSVNTVTDINIGGTEYIAVVTDIGDNDWSFVSSLPLSYVKQQYVSISHDVAILILIIFIAFALMFISILHLMRSNDSISKTNERFTLVTVDSQDLVYDYDFRRQTVTLEGSIREIIGDTDKNVYTRAEGLSILNEIMHPEDRDIITRILEIKSGTENSIRSEFRLRCPDGEYSWFRLKGMIVRGHDDLPQRFIGSLIYADDRSDRNLAVGNRYETDALTGILNKSTFFDRVNEQLRRSSDSDLFAVYLIDLDNFQRSNDELGHAVGDRILTDVAKKLCIVFSDKDIVGRIKGDEFAAFLQLSAKARTSGMSIIENKAQAICSNIKETYESKNGDVTITASVGVSIFPYSGRDYNTLFRKADQALHYVKENGKNGFNICSPSD